MSLEKIKCPKCGTDIPNSAIIIQRIQEQIKEKSRQEFEKEFTEKESISIEQLRNQLSEEKRKREESQKKELEILKLKEDLDDRGKSLDLEVQKKLIEEKHAIEEKATKDAQVLYELKFAEKEKQLEDQKKLIAEMQRKAHQGSMQMQGEVMELALEEILKSNFPHDEIKPVPKGINGADIIQIVYTTIGQKCGSIVWESKQTKAWTEDWVQKLKDDGRNIKGSILVLVSEALPKDMKNFGLYKGIWVSNFSSILGLTMALRNHLIAVSSVITSETGKEEKASQIYKYICSDQFAQKIQSTVETFDQMKKTIEIEKRAMIKLWAQRETQILRLNENVAKMYGTIQGIAQLPNIELLELESGLNEAESVHKKISSKNTTPSEDQSSLFT
ncbi:MAG: DUF2130 domain-containing protein [Patescibacteria group bacterium]